MYGREAMCEAPVTYCPAILVRLIWWREGDSNSRPTDYETVALAS
jgi:hypothetical protein